MLDRRTALLLQKINLLCVDGSYKILEKDELLSAFPAYLPQGEEGLAAMLQYLKEHEYIDVRYADKERGVYCLYPLPAGRLYAESVTNEQAKEARELKRILLAAFLSAFVGSTLGAGMVALFFALLV
ncbi:MAG: hypothetical protein IKC91_00570 [Clostridia bacterium]|nr:hypothetical protein [Clostridia bacterium]